MHGAGTNRTTDRFRMANLLQVSSAFGRAMEAIDRTRMTLALYPALTRLRADGRLTETQADDAIAAAAEGYAFPTNLDTDPPIGGLAPKSQAGPHPRGAARRHRPRGLRRPDPRARRPAPALSPHPSPAARRPSTYIARSSSRTMP